MVSDSIVTPGTGPLPVGLVDPTGGTLLALPDDGEVAAGTLGMSTAPLSEYYGPEHLPTFRATYERWLAGAVLHELAKHPATAAAVKTDGVVAAAGVAASSVLLRRTFLRLRFAAPLLTGSNASVWIVSAPPGTAFPVPLITSQQCSAGAGAVCESGRHAERGSDRIFCART